jgi:uncharacterized membrane protein
LKLLTPLYRPLVGLVVVVSTVVIATGHVDRLPAVLSGAGALFGLVVAMHDGIADRATGEDWFTLLLVFPLLMALVGFACGCVVAFVHGVVVR